MKYAFEYRVSDFCRFIITEATRPYFNWAAGWKIFLGNLLKIDYLDSWDDQVLKIYLLVNDCKKHTFDKGDQIGTVSQCVVRSKVSKK